MRHIFVRMLCIGALTGAPMACNQADPMVSTDGASDTGEDPSTDGGDLEPSSGDTADGPTQPTTDTGDETPTTDDQTDSGPPPLEGDYYPLVDGATWTYRHTDEVGAVWDELVHMREVEYMGMTAYEAEDNEDANNESTIATLFRDGTMTHRIHKDVSLAGVPIASVDYDPGFLRFDESFGNASDGDSLDWNYERTEYDAGGAMVGMVESRLMIFTVESTSTSVTVPAGTFDCVQLRRERLDNGEIKRYWFARGVGKVRHETVGSGKSEELIEYSIP
ncbi:hypothetical protein [Paraliomyxa miuraensis]|uniref:hypothetical protein n=1 Tax=Paraliomyxa miuraensis TaxID=376150 RepID=UPI00224D7D50|nr:hypothetical protein [Paraliomyxa miuraensis]MCX4245309.1 hypothetical protein [Paraliomyxa miuraensis]